MVVRMIIIDDEPWSREVVKTLTEWERLGITLAGEADDGDAGLELLRSVPVDIVIADMKMPGIDGIDLLKAIHKDFPSVKILVMSGYDDFAYLRQALKSKALDYLMKPIDPTELNNILQQCVTEIEAGTRGPISMRTPVLFQNREVLDEYVEHRRRVFACLLKLDSAGVAETLQDLQNYLVSHSEGFSDADVRSRIIHDYLLLLEEFLIRSEVTPEPGIFRDRQIEQLNHAEMFDALAAVSAEAIDLIKEARRFKDYLDTDMVKDHIDHYFQEPISLETVAQMFLVSKEHLSRAFRKSQQETVNEYITRRRMEAARHMIIEEEIEIKEAAYLSGYSDLAYFYRVFKKHFGSAPGQLRK